MQPVLFELFGFPIHSYGVSKLLALMAAGFLLAREFRRLGWDPEHAWNMVVAGTLLGFAGGKLYYLAENAGHLTPHHFGSSGFTWYGGLIAGILTVTVMARRYGLPLRQLAGVVAAPLSLAYAIGRVGCFLSGDGSYGQPSNLPWAMAFPDGTMPTTVPVHPAALYEAAVATVIAGVLWYLRTRVDGLTVFGLYAILTGSARFLVEEIRINPEALFGLTQPQLWSALLVAVGAWLLVVGRRQDDRSPNPSGAHNPHLVASEG